MQVTYNIYSLYFALLIIDGRKRVNGLFLLNIFINDKNIEHDVEVNNVSGFTQNINNLSGINCMNIK